MKCCFSGKLPPLGHLGERMAIKIEDICSSQVQLPSLLWLTRWQFRQTERQRVWRKPTVAKGEVADAHCSGNSIMTGEIGWLADVNTEVLSSRKSYNTVFELVTKLRNAHTRAKHITLIRDEIVNHEPFLDFWIIFNQVFTLLCGGNKNLSPIFPLRRSLLFRY